MQDHRSKIRVELASWDKLTNLTPNGSSAEESSESLAKDALGSPTPQQTARSMVSSVDARLGAAKSYDDALAGPSATRDNETKFEVVLVFDSENTCNLALKYLQSKRYVDIVPFCKLVCLSYHNKLCSFLYSLVANLPGKASLRTYGPCWKVWYCHNLRFHPKAQSKESFSFFK